MTPPETLAKRIQGIVIGTSAGGVEALSLLLPALPARMRAAVFIVLHLPRERSSLLVEIFSGCCALTVREGQDKEPVAPATVYFAPPDYHMLLDQGPQIVLSADDAVNFSRPSIDVLFESAADIYADRLMGIVLSGGNDDGAAGLEAVRQAGGFTVVQRPDSAQSPFMPVAAIRRGTPDLVLSLEEIAALLATLDSDGTVQIARAGPE
jgi:two-component system chemotaxis response regulator CheB